MTMNHLEDMRLFVQTVDSASFTAAAEKLGLSKQFVSKRLAALEARLGVRLLIRTTRTLRTTALGVNYYEQRSEEHTSELQSLMRNSYAVFCLKQKTTTEASSWMHRGFGAEKRHTGMIKYIYRCDLSRQ